MTNKRESEVLATLDRVKSGVGGFLGLLKGGTPGYYRYSLSGDLFDEGTNWGLGASVFALKTRYLLEGATESSDTAALCSRILAFRRPEGEIFDPLIRWRGLPAEILVALRQKRLPDFSRSEYRRAETRQSYSALALFGKLPDKLPWKPPGSPEHVRSFLESMDWSRPWGAGSHFSHLMFFLDLARRSKLMEEDAFHSRKAAALNWLEGIRRSDGGWYTGQPEADQKINGAMKVLTGLIAVDEQRSCGSPRMMDLCLDTPHARHACDNLNAILVVKTMAPLLPGYRRSDVELFAWKRLETVLGHFHPETGGFSFYPKKANMTYYGAKVTRGFAEPDIHGTVLLLWGVAMLSDLLGLNDRVGLKEFRT